MATVGLIEDSKVLTAMLGDKLLLRGHEHFVCDDGAALPELLARQQPDVLIVDLRVPNFDPAQLPALLATHCPGARMVLYSTARDGELQAMKRALSADEALPKTPDLERVMEAVEACLRLDADKHSAGAKRRRRDVVLLVDDDADQKVLLERLLAPDGIELVATTSSLITNLVREYNPCLILMDIELSGIRSGLDVTRFLKQSGHAGATPIVFYSAKDEAELLGLVREYGADGFIAKRQPPGALHQAIHRAIERGPQPGSLI